MLRQEVTQESHWPVLSQGGSEHNLGFSRGLDAQGAMKGHEALAHFVATQAQGGFPSHLSPSQALEGQTLPQEARAEYFSCTPAFQG